MRSTSGPCAREGKRSRRKPAIASTAYRAHKHRRENAISYWQGTKVACLKFAGKRAGTGTSSGPRIFKAFLMAVRRSHRCRPPAPPAARNGKRDGDHAATCRWCGNDELGARDKIEEGKRRFASSLESRLRQRWRRVPVKAETDVFDTRVTTVTAEEGSGTPQPV